MINTIQISAVTGLLLAASLLFGGCAEQGALPLLQVGEVSQASRRPALYVIIQRDKRLPAAFTDTFAQISRQVLPGFDLAVTEGLADGAALARADWVMTLRATRIIPDYSFKPASDNLINGVNDSIWGSGLGVGLFFAPSVFYGDEDFIEATLRNAKGDTLKIYQVTATESGFFWPLFPSAWVWNSDQNSRWREQIGGLYRKIANDRLFENQGMASD
ncbi:MAG: hypothetical protein PHW13_09590 [Methylococcales bacterium]|nr:hypothetical protein [Methylococcales bacterium]